MSTNGRIETKQVNPYQPTPTTQSPINKVGYRPVLLLGFLTGYAPVAGLGLINYARFRLAVAALPAGTGVCGNTVIECALLVFVVAPVAGLVTMLIAQLFFLRR